MSERVERLRAALEGLGAASFLVTRPVNLRYLTGFDSSNAALVVAARPPEPRGAGNERTGH